MILILFCFYCFQMSKRAIIVRQEHGSDKRIRIEGSETIEPVKEVIKNSLSYIKVVPPVKQEKAASVIIQEKEPSSSKIVFDYNPWNVANFDAFLVYDCPQCSFKDKDCHRFAKHAAHNHQKVCYT